jgi:hypothetical protein
LEAPIIFLKAISNDGKLLITFSEKVIYPQELEANKDKRELEDKERIIKKYIDIKIVPFD